MISLCLCMCMPMLLQMCVVGPCVQICSGITPLVGTCGGLFTTLSIGLSFAFLPLGLLLTMVALVNPDAITSLTSLCAGLTEQIPGILAGLTEQIPGILGAVGLTVE